MMGTKAHYAMFLLATGIGLWIGGSFLGSAHLDDTSLPKRT
jgi:hypothetical protein